MAAGSCCSTACAVAPVPAGAATSPTKSLPSDPCTPNRNNRKAPSPARAQPSPSGARASSNPKAPVLSGSVRLTVEMMRELVAAATAGQWTGFDEFSGHQYLEVRSAFGQNEAKPGQQRAPVLRGSCELPSATAARSGAEQWLQPACPAVPAAPGAAVPAAPQMQPAAQPPQQSWGVDPGQYRQPAARRRRSTRPRPLPTSSRRHCPRRPCQHRLRRLLSKRRSPWPMPLAAWWHRSTRGPSDAVGRPCGALRL